MSQNLWATIMPYGPVTNILLAPKKKIRASISGVVIDTLQKIVYWRWNHCYTVTTEILFIGGVVIDTL